MNSVMTAQVDGQRQWYLAVGEQSLGPLSTELVVRGICSGKVPPTAWVCPVGASDWVALSSVGEFQMALENPPVDGSSHGSESNNPLSQGLRESPLDESSQVEARHASARAILPYEQTEVAIGVMAAAGRDDVAARHSQKLGLQTDVATPNTQGWQVVGGAVELTAHPKTARRQPSAYDIGVEIAHEDALEAQVDWNQRFLSYFLVGANVELPEEDRLLASLQQMPRHSILHDEALWNLSLCLAFGSERLAFASAAAIHEALATEREPSRAAERLEWVCRALLSKGFMPSGIPRVEGRRGLEILRGASNHVYSHIIDRAFSS